MTSRTYSSDFDVSADKGGSATMELFRVLLTVIFPPLGVFLRVGASIHFVLSLLLTCFGYLPGLVHGIWLLAQSSSHRLRIERA